MGRDRIGRRAEGRGGRGTAVHHQLGRAAVLVVLVVGLVFAAPTTSAATPPTALGATAPVPAPTLSLPPAGLRGHALWDSYYDLEPFGYEDQELFVSGTARDAAGTAAPFTTRMIVTRPTDPADFNGTVLLDWVNVTAQFENAVDTMLAREMLMREGFAYVHVSAQKAGLCCTPGLTPEMWDPVRYAALDHPGDAWAFDIFTQVAQAFRTPATAGAPDPMGSLGVTSVARVLAAGQSQSGIRLFDYLDTWLPSHPDAIGVIDAFLVHGDVGKPKRFAQPLPVPVLKLLSDFEAVDDGVDPATLDPNLRLWEVAGTAHADLFIGHQSIFGHGPRVVAGAARMSADAYRGVIEAAGMYGEQVSAEEAVCTAAGATMPMRYATSAALHQLDRWVRGGAPPAHGPRFEFAAGALAQDGFGNTLGGIRLPPIDVPVAQYQSTLCSLGGITVPFTDLQIQGLYPTHAEYLARMAERADAAVRAGWLLPDDAVDLMRRACAASNRWPAGQATCASYTPPAFASGAAPPTSSAPSAGGPPPGPSAPLGPIGVLPATGRAGSLARALALTVGALLLSAARRLRARSERTVRAPRAVDAVSSES